LYDEVKEELLQVMKSCKDEYHRNMKDSYPNILYWEKRYIIWRGLFFISCYSLISVLYFRGYFHSLKSLICPLIELVEISLIIFIFIGYFLRVEKRRLQTNNEDLESMVSNKMINHLRKKYKERASVIVIFLINDSTKKQNQSNLEKNTIFTELRKLPELVVTSFFGYSIGVVSKDVFKIPYYIVPVTILILWGLIIVCEFAVRALWKFHRENTQEHLLINILQDIKYKL